MNSLGEKIKNLRLENNLTQEMLADKLFVSNKTISSWECDRTIPDINMLFKLSSIFHCNLYSLLEQNYYNNVPLEIEVKLKVNDNEYKRLLNLLKNQSNNIKEVTEIDTYFKLTNKKEYKEVLRIRQENDLCILGYKKENSDKTRDEFETIIDNYENLEKILLNLGLEKKGVIEKKRTKILYKNKYEFAFDNVFVEEKDIGKFVEIEVTNIEFNNIEEINQLMDIINEFQIDINLITDKKYNEYLED